MLFTSSLKYLIIYLMNFEFEAANIINKWESSGQKKDRPFGTVFFLLEIYLLFRSKCFPENPWATCTIIVVVDLNYTCCRIISIQVSCIIWIT